MANKKYNPLDKFNKRLKRAEDISEYVQEELRNEGLSLTDRGFLSMDNLKNLSDEESSELISKLEKIIPQKREDFVYKFSYDMFEEILLDYYNFENGSGDVVMDTNKGRLGHSQNYNKLSQEQKKALEKLMRGEYDAESDTYSGGLGSAFRKKTAGYDTQTMNVLREFRGIFGRRQ